MFGMTNVAWSAQYVLGNGRNDDIITPIRLDVLLPYTNIIFCDFKIEIMSNFISV